MDKKAESTWLEKYRDKKILILGLGREGVSSYHFLRKHLPDQKLILVDKLKLKELSPKLQTKVAEDSLAEFVLDDAGLDLSQFEIIVKSAGITPYTKRFEKIRQAGIEFSSNIKLFFEVIESQKQPNQDFPSYPLVIGVTGTKGKTTTASLIHHVLKESGLNSKFGGNVGHPALDMLDESANNKNIYVLELSSNQLLDLETSPDIAVVQQLSPEHLDYYPNVDTYYHAKYPIAKYQRDQDWLLYYQGSSQTVRLAEASPAQKIPFNLNNPSLELSSADGWLIYQNEKIISASEIPLKGKHNLLNTLPSIAVGKLFNLNKSQISTAIKSFKSIEHRLESAGIVRGVEFINDSAGTTPEATIAALQTYADKSIILLAGGSEKGAELDQLAEEILASNIKLLLLFPTTGKKIWQALMQVCKQKNKSMPHHMFVSSMEGAFKWIQAEMAENVLVLLSPACASFSTFKNYQDRGNQFKHQVKLLQV